MLPPDAPDDLLSAWLAAFDKAVNDPGYLADATRRLQKIEPRSGAEVQSLVARLYATPKPWVRYSWSGFPGATSSAREARRHQSTLRQGSGRCVRQARHQADG